MSRVKFLECRQSEFLNRIKTSRNLEWPDIAGSCGVHTRTLFDWRRNKYQMGYESLSRLTKRYNLALPKRIEILPDTWNIKNAARLGALRRNELYGPPGTQEDRRKGGLTTWRRYRVNPKRFEGTGFNGPKDIICPQKSHLLAELIGIILGDGSLTKYQIRVSLNNKTEKEYAVFISDLIKKLFKIKVNLAIRKKNACDLVVSGVNLIKYLVSLGLSVGDKMHNRVRIPKWILANRSYATACLRGLIDTDGGVYYHNHVTKGIRYLHLGLGFTSHSYPLLKDAHNIFLSLDFPAKINSRGHVFLYDRREIERYFIKIGTHNIHHLQRYRNYFIKRGEVRKWL